MATTQDFRAEVRGRLAIAEAAGAEELVIVSGELHKSLGAKNQMPMACNAMKQCMQAGDTVVFSPPSGQGSTLRIRYLLPRRDEPALTLPQPGGSKESIGIVAVPEPEWNGHPTATRGEPARMLVVLSCTKSKMHEPPNRLLWKDFMDRGVLAAREEELSEWALPAAEMYTGQQFIHAMRGVRTLRQAFGPSFVDVRIISAGYGLIEEDRRIVPYEVTFSGLPLGAVAWRADYLNIPEALAQATSTHPVNVFLLGHNYLIAAGVPPSPPEGCRHIFLCGAGGMPWLEDGSTAVPMTAALMHKLGAGQIAVKGRAFEVFAEGLARLGDAQVQVLMSDDTPATFLEILHEGLQ